MSERKSIDPIPAPGSPGNGADICHAICAEPDPADDHVADALKEILDTLDAREAAGAGPFSPQPDLFLRYVGIHAASRPGTDVAGTLRRIKSVIGDGASDPGCRLDIVRSLCRVELRSRRGS